jgi:hypothetical protein
MLVVLSAICESANASAQTIIVNIAVDSTDPFNLSDTEPSIAVNPLNPQEIVVVSFSENWGPGVLAAVWRSLDGGNTWSKTFQLPEPATGFSGPRDQKLAFDSAGRLYAAELGGSQDFIYRQTGAATDPLTPSTAFGDDQPHLEVDRGSAASCAHHVYVPWLNFAAGPRSMVSNSTTAGGTITDVAVGDAAFANRTTRIALAPDGSAYVIFKTREGATVANFEKAHFRVRRSDDCGVTWGALGAASVSVHGATAAETFFTNEFGNPAKGKVARARSSDAWIAADPGDGDIYAAYVDRDASNFGQIYVARSRDRGATWSANRVTRGSTHAAYPEVAVAANGAVGVLYIEYDDSGATTLFRHRFAQSTNNGSTWRDTVLQTMDPGPLTNAMSGYLWGDYEGLTAQGNEFFGVFTGASSGRTVAQLDPIFFRAGAGPVFGWLCITQPGRCRPPIRMFPEGLVIQCLTLPCIVRDPIPRNCLVKFRCPGCEAGLCPPYYQLHITGLGPAWDVGLFDRRGRPVAYTQHAVRGGTVIDFRPPRNEFTPGAIADYYLAFQPTEQAALGRRYTARVRLVRSQEPYTSPSRPR